ncbi:hypothetical protein GCM10027168_02720 [Streptomyces capparidis]
MHALEQPLGEADGDDEVPLLVLGAGLGAVVVDHGVSFGGAFGSRFVRRRLRQVIPWGPQSYQELNFQETGR